MAGPASAGEPEFTLRGRVERWRDTFSDEDAGLGGSAVVLEKLDEASERVPVATGQIVSKNGLGFVGSAGRLEDVREHSRGVAFSKSYGVPAQGFDFPVAALAAKGAREI
jgi:hypothetical protein